MRVTGSIRQQAPWLGIMVLALMLMVTVAAQTATSAEPMTADQIEEQLGRLNRRIIHQSELVRINEAGRGVDSEALNAEAEGLATDLDLIELEISALAGEEGQRLLEKVYGLRTIVDNLRLVALTGDTRQLPPALEPAEALRVGGLSQDVKAVPSNDSCDQATVVGVGTYVGDSSEATNDGQASCGASMLSPDVWFYFLVESSDTFLVDSAGSLFDTVLSVHPLCPGTMSNQIACNDDFSGLQSAVSFEAAAGEDYLIRLSGVNGASGSYVLNINRAGSITGTVTAEATGDPLESTRVRVWSSEGGSAGYTNTDSSGVYLFSGLHSGIYYVGTDTSYGSSDYLDELYDGIFCPGGVTDPTSGQPVTVTLNTTVAGIDFTLLQGGSISGTVRDTTTGAGIASAITIYQESGSEYRSGYSSSTTGEYSFSRLLPGTYYAVAESYIYNDVLFNDQPCLGGAPHGCDPVTGTPIIVQTETTTSGIDFDLLRRGRISGSVTDSASGLPLYQAYVTIYDSAGYKVKTVYSDSDGGYLEGGLDDGTYYVVATKRNYCRQLFDGLSCSDSLNVTAGLPVVIAGQGEVTGVDFAMLPFGRISGTVSSSLTAAPEVGVRVVLYDSQGFAVDYSFSDSDGAYSSSPLDDGTYYAKVDDSDYINQLYDDIPCSSCDPTTGTPVLVSAGADATGIDFEVLPKGIISGTVTDIDTGAPLTVTVRVYDSAGSFVGSSLSTGGSYSVSGLETGSYFIATDDSGDYLDRLYNGIDCWGGPYLGCNPVDGQPVAVTTGLSTSAIDFQLQQAGSISGTLVDAVDGANISGAIEVLRANGESYGRTTVSGGAYTISGIVPGSYYVVAEASTSTMYADGIYDGLACQGEFPEQCDLTGGTLVTVSEGATTTGIDFALDRFATISGRVIDSTTGMNLSYASVNLYSSDGTFVDRAFSGSWGWAYTFYGVYPGTYYIVTYANGDKYADQLFDQIPCSPPAGCGDVTTGTPIAVAFNDAVTGIDFRLVPTGAISGQVLDELTGSPISDLRVVAYDSSGEEVSEANSDDDGFYTLIGLYTGSYFVATDHISYPEYFNELYDDLFCSYGPPASCDPTKGTPVPVTLGQVTRFIDFTLVPKPSNGAGLAGVVTDAETGEPIEGIYIDVWSAGTSEHVVNLPSKSDGSYLADLSPGAYHVSTDNGNGWVNQIWSRVRCTQGSVYNGACPADAGDLITLVDGEITTGIDFVMNEWSIFSDGFESGDTSAWSAIQ